MKNERKKLFYPNLSEQVNIYPRNHKNTYGFLIFPRGKMRSDLLNTKRISKIILKNDFNNVYSSEMFLKAVAYSTEVFVIQKRSPGNVL